MDPMTADTLKRIAALAGFDWSEAELLPLGTALARALESFRELETLPVDGVEPSTQFRIL